MPVEIDRNQIDSEGRGRSTEKGDVPDPMRRRYYLDDRGGPGLGFYTDALVKTAAFRDLGARLVSARADPNAIRDMTAVAQHRGWSSVVVHGAKNFRREVWLAAMAVGIEVRGHHPTERDRQELARRREANERRHERTLQHEAGKAPDKAAEKTNLRVAQAVVRARIADSPSQERILAAARGRIANWLERGAQMSELNLGRQPTPVRHQGRERTR